MLCLGGVWDAVLGNAIKPGNKVLLPYGYSVNYAGAACVAWSFLWSGLDQINSIQGLSHNLTLHKITYLSLRHKSGYGHAISALKQPITPPLYS